jgi:hypothetical protein
MVRVLAHGIGEFSENSGAKSGHFSVTNEWWFLRHQLRPQASQTKEGVL